MANVLKRYNGTSWEAVGGTITGDTLPIGSEVDYTGTDIPAGWEEVSGTNKIKKVSQVAGLVGGVSNEFSESTNDAYSCDYVNGLNTYSTTETICGTWINGKPLYKKTFTFTVTHTSSTSTVADNIAHNIDNVDTIFIDQGHSFFTDGATDYVLGRTYISSKTVIASIAAVVTATNIRTEVFLESNASFDFTITLNYTKTTD